VLCDIIFFSQKERTLARVFCGIIIPSTKKCVMFRFSGVAWCGVDNLQKGKGESGKRKSGGGEWTGKCREIGKKACLYQINQHS